VALVIRRYRVTVDGRTFDVEVEEVGADTRPPTPPAVPEQREESRQPAPPPAPAAPAAPAASTPPPPARGGQDIVKAPLPGLVSTLRVTAGQRVEAGQVLCILEAMKMENEITAPRAGVVEALHVTAGTTVSAGDPILTLA
jgi:biotin carboxyl carrier protein